MKSAREKVAWEGREVSAVWNHADRPGPVLVLGHGAGGTLHTPGLVHFAEALAARGITVVRFNFPYAEDGRRVPDPPPRLEAAYRAVASHVADRIGLGEGRERDDPALFLGGRSMGGRIASHVVADGFPAEGLIFLGYPLHPPDRPERLRDAHLSRIAVPVLFLQGSRDSFARPDLLARTLERLPLATLHVIAGADHGLSVRGRPADDVLAELTDATAGWIDDIAGRPNRRSVGARP